MGSKRKPSTMENRRAERQRALDALIKMMAEEAEELPFISEMELSTEKEMRAFGKKQFEMKLANASEEDDSPKPCPKCKKKWRVRAKKVERKFKSSFGEHLLRRNQHYCEDCKSSFYPADDLLGLPKDADVTLELARKILDMGLNDPLEFGAERWNFHYPHIEISSNQIRGVVERTFEKMKSCNEVLLQTSLLAPKEVDDDILYVMNDGGMLPMQGGEWRECKSGVIFRGKNHVPTSETKRGMILAPRYISTLQRQQEFKKELEAALSVENIFSAKRVVWVADGAKGNWALADALAPGATQILDFYHALEHASDAAKIFFGEGHIGVELFREGVKILLLSGDLKTLFSQLKEYLKLADTQESRESFRKLIGYYRNNAKRMKYAEYLADGLMIGSGVMESSHRHVIQRRMKLAGQHWSLSGGDAMARMRAAYKTSGPHAFFHAIRAAHRKTLTLKRHPNFSKPFKKRRASNR